jgi:hypothetical protein
MIIKEAFANIRKRINFIPSLKTSFKDENTQKDQEKGKNVLSSAAGAPGGVQKLH